MEPVPHPKATAAHVVPAVAALSSPTEPAATALAPDRRWQPAPALLWEAHAFAQQCSCCPWQFAVTYADLRTAGMLDVHLHWLLCRGVLEHAVERTRPADAERTFRRSGNRALFPRRCFVLTAAGLDWLRGLDAASGGGWAPAGLERLEADAARRRGQPYWHDGNRNLYWQGDLLVHFQRDAPYQGALLRHFQKNQWRTWISVPVLPHGPTGRKQRLHDAVKHLNANVQPHLHFFQEGNGDRVGWEPGTTAP